jgi:hypothetical protein
MITVKDKVRLIPPTQAQCQLYHSMHSTLLGYRQSNQSEWLCPTIVYSSQADGLPIIRCFHVRSPAFDIVNSGWG